MVPRLRLRYGFQAAWAGGVSGGGRKVERPKYLGHEQSDCPVKVQARNGKVAETGSEAGLLPFTCLFPGANP